jgi:L-fuconolactonase
MTDSVNARRGVPPHHYIDEEWLAQRDEPVLEPGLPIVDPHHHLWDRPHHRYLLPEIMQDLKSGHQIRGTVFIECSSMYRADGDRNFASVGEVEFVNGLAAMSASGIYGPVRVAAGIIGRVDLTLGDAAQPILEACMSRAPDRFKGVRHMAAVDPALPPGNAHAQPPVGLLLDERFRTGFRVLGRLGLTFESWVYHTQLPKLISLVDAAPEIPVVVNHFGGRVGIGPYAEAQDDVFRAWSTSIAELARRPNVRLKLGGIGMRLAGFGFLERDLPPTSEELAKAWRPYFEVCVDAFGPDRCMFESNFPVDKATATYRITWNTFKRLAASFTAEEKAKLFSGTAITAYRLPPELGVGVEE